MQSGWKKQKQFSTKIKTTIDNLEKEPRPSGIKKLSGSKDEYRIRVSDYRILFPSMIIVKLQLSTKSNTAEKSTGKYPRSTNPYENPHRKQHALPGSAFT